jgi:integrase
MQSIVDGSGLNKPTLKKIKSLTNHLYNYAVKHEIVTKEKKDVMSYLDLSKAENPNQIERIPFTKDEIKILWEHESDIPLFLIYTGLRIGEFYDLKWENVHLQNRYFDVIKSKTTAGIRSVPIHDKLIPILERHKGSEYVFTNMSGGHFTDHVFRDVYWNRIMESLDMDHKPHDTRHTCVSLLTEAKVDERIIKSIVGHKGSGVTEQVYTHIGMDAKLEAINKI